MGPFVDRQVGLVGGVCSADVCTMKPAYKAEQPSNVAPHDRHDTTLTSKHETLNDIDPCTTSYSPGGTSAIIING